MSTAASSGINLFIAAPATGTLNNTGYLFIKGGNETSNNTMTLFVGSNRASGLFTLVVPGGSDMFPKEWHYARRAGVNSDGYYPIGQGITIFVNGS